uniref:Uncharacterized protein n=1 Tax=Tanacetum cinerariifolium TaxID=118510 RepID=A0A699T9T8_TANCI|nr:hypothetical protein [Tanacetum cinerariifolium]
MGQNTPCFEENSRKSYTSSDKVKKELKDIGFKGTCIGAPKLANNQDKKSMTWAGDQSCVPKKDVPSHGPRKQQLSGLIFRAELERPVGFDLRAFEGIHCNLWRDKQEEHGINESFTIN